MILNWCRLFFIVYVMHKCIPLSSIWGAMTRILKVGF